MVRHLHFREDMVEEHVAPLVGRIETMLENPDDSVRLFFDSGGGEYPILLMLLSLSCENPERIEIVFCNSAHSAAFTLLLFAPCKVKVSHDIGCIAHLFIMSCNDERGMDRKLSLSQERMDGISRLNGLLCEVMQEAGMEEGKMELFCKRQDVVLGRDEVVAMRASVQDMLKVPGSKSSLFMDSLLCR
jgi:hypothetical protein